MDFLKQNLLTILIFLPSVGAILTMLVRGRDAVRWTALITTIVTFALSLLLLATFDWNVGSGEAVQQNGDYAYNTADRPFGVVQMIQRAPWIKSFNIEYLVGIDGLSFPLVILSTFICMLSCIASWNIEKMTKGYMALFLFLETGILGVFLALDFFLFYVFFEISLLPMYFLIGIWGGPRKEYAAIKFFLYTLVGSIGLLIVLIGVFMYTGSFDMIQLPALLRAKLGDGAGMIGSGMAKTFFLLLMVGFLIKVPAVPFHTWLPD